MLPRDIETTPSSRRLGRISFSIAVPKRAERVKANASVLTAVRV